MCSGQTFRLSQRNSELAGYDQVNLTVTEHQSMRFTCDSRLATGKMIPACSTSLAYNALLHLLQEYVSQRRHLLRSIKSQIEERRRQKVCFRHSSH